jgi:hypothetical protein
MEDWAEVVRAITDVDDSVEVFTVALKERIQFFTWINGIGSSTFMI